jgi:hypothetical protein
MGCGCNAKKTQEEDEYSADNQEKSVGGPMDSKVCSQGKDAYSDAESSLYDTFISLFAGVIGFYATGVFKVEGLYGKSGIVFASVLLGNILSKNLKVGKTIAGMRFEQKCKGDE